MKPIYYKKYFLMFLTIAFVFSQTLKREGNLIILEDGSIIEIDEQALEDYFFIEIDKTNNQKSEEAIPSFDDLEFEDNESNVMEKSIEKEDSSHLDPSQRSLNDEGVDYDYSKGFQNDPILLPEQNNNQYLKQPEHIFSDIVQSPPSPTLFTLPEKNLFLSKKTIPLNLRTASDYIYRDSLALVSFPLTPIYLAQGGQDSRSLRRGYNTKSNRINIDNDIFDPELNTQRNPDQIFLRSGNQPHDIEGKTETKIEENQIFNLQNIPEPVEPQIENKQPTDDKNNYNNFTVNLYNLTNLLDQIFSKVKPEVKQPTPPVRDDAWQKAYNDILDQEVLGVIERSNVNNENEEMVRDFIIKLPLHYKLIYGDQLIRPPDKPAITQPEDAQTDRDDYYKNSVNLLTNILKSFPDVNNNSINVVIITNTAPLQNQTRNKIPNPSYYNNVDPQLQNELYNIQRKNNYNIGLELAEAKNLFYQGKYTLVLKKLHKLEENEPYNTRVKNIIGSTYYKIGFYEFAERYWRESLSLDPNQPLVAAYLDRISQYGSNTDGDLNNGLIDPPN